MEHRKFQAELILTLSRMKLEKRERKVKEKDKILNSRSKQIRSMNEKNNGKIKKKYLLVIGSSVKNKIALSSLFI